MGARHALDLTPHVRHDRTVTGRTRARRLQRRRIAVHGIVQGVGFRPFVYGLACRFSLRGFVRNAPDGVLIEVEGEHAALEDFQTELTRRPPLRAVIDECATVSVPPRGERDFRIETSHVAADPGSVIRVSPDVATCDDCLADLFDPSNRRFRYPFVTCAACGPRLTVVRGVPYDRERTTMAAFRMCDGCRREYEDPVDRRFHAETIACPACGPRARLYRADGSVVHGDPFAALAAGLADGRIAAVKGVGGYHLACDATDPGVVAELRRRKHRDAKPFAVMFGSLEAIGTECVIEAAARELLQSPASPIVLLRRREGVRPLGPCPQVAPGCPELGAMLPSTPVHHLLMNAVGRPLVMTSGNRSDEPIAYEDADAFTRLAGIADVFLVHDRPIRVRCDDGVSRVVRGRELPGRRSRGQAPRPIRLPIAAASPVLAVGGHMKNTFALGRGFDAVVSHHIGDLDDLRAYQAFCRDVALYEQMFGMAPASIAHDLHPDYASTRYAVERSTREHVALIGVQHHHAHVASCIAEHGLTERVIGVAFDGTGFGEDETVWGGEFLVGDTRSVTRAGHLRPVALPGGEQAVREPWRMALSHLLDADLDRGALLNRIAHPQVRAVERMIERRLNTPLTSSAGRLFDAVAAIAGVCDRVSFEGQAAMQLEWLASDAAADVGYPYEITEAGNRFLIDTRPIVAGAFQDACAARPPAIIARRFHTALVDAIAAACIHLRSHTGLDAVVLTGGVFLNALLTAECELRLSQAAFRVFRHHVVPPGDGGISLGQLAVAAARSQTACA